MISDVFIRGKRIDSIMINVIMSGFSVVFGVFGILRLLVGWCFY